MGGLTSLGCPYGPYSGDDDFDNEYGTIYIATLIGAETILMILSIMATILHFRDSGKRFTTLAKFHVAHTTFSLCFVGFQLRQAHKLECYHSQWPTCEEVYLQGVKQISEFYLFILTWILYANYWEKVLGREIEQHARARTIVFVVVLLGYTLGLVYTKSGGLGCDMEIHEQLKGGKTQHKNYLKRSIIHYCLTCPIAIVLIVDSFRMARMSFKRIKGITYQRNPVEASQHKTINASVTFSILMKCWYLIGIFISFLAFFVFTVLMSIPAIYRVDTLYLYFPVDSEFCSFVLPGFLMLRGTWKRRYLVLKSRSDPSDSVTNVERILGSVPNVDDDHDLSRDLLSDIERAEAVPERSSNTISTEEDLRHLLVSTAGLRSFFDFQESHRIPLIVQEELRPPEYATCSVVRMFLENVALPHLEHIKKDIHGRINDLLVQTKPFYRRGSTMGVLMERSEFSDLKTKCSTLRHRFADWVNLMQSSINSISKFDSVPRDVRKFYFKTSKLKKCKPLTFFSTNLQIHVTEIRRHDGTSQPAGDPIIHRNRLSSYVDSPDRARTITVTYGAPTAHVLGWKAGFTEFGDDEDFWDEENQLRSQESGGSSFRESLHVRLFDSHTKKPSVDSGTPNNPRQILEGIELDFAGEQRAAVVLSQALGALVAACVEHLAETIERRNSVVLRQIEAIGLLVHEVCLLSTIGNETIMIQDMAAALSRLNVVLRVLVDDDSSDGAFDINVDGVESARVTKNYDEIISSESMGDLIVTLRLSSADPEIRGFFNSNTITHPVEIKVVPTLFNLGVNEMQTVCNVVRSAALETQTTINRAGLVGMQAYFDDFRAYTAENEPSNADINTDIDKAQESLDQLDHLIEIEASLVGGGKNVELLLVSCFCARLLKGARTTSCKSAKDRTSMFATLEACKVAENLGIIHNEEDMQAIVDELRGENGVRLCNCEQNTGKKKFAFNAMQIKALPRELRPPVHAASAGMVS